MAVGDYYVGVRENTISFVSELLYKLGTAILNLVWHDRSEKADRDYWREKTIEEVDTCTLKL